MPTINPPKRRPWEKQERAKVIFNYKQYRWKKESKEFLEDNPLCKRCLKEDKPIIANQVHHTSPIELGLIDPWDRNYWEPICQHHHSQITANTINEKKKNNWFKQWG